MCNLMLRNMNIEMGRKLKRMDVAVNDYINVNRLPIPVVNRIREPMNNWLDNWVIRENFLGDSK